MSVALVVGIFLYGAYKLARSEANYQSDIDKKPQNVVDDSHQSANDDDSETFTVLDDLKQGKYSFEDFVMLTEAANMAVDESSDLLQKLNVALYLSGNKTSAGFFCNRKKCFDSFEFGYCSAILHASTDNFFFGCG